MPVEYTAPGTGTQPEYKSSVPAEDIAIMEIEDVPNKEAYRNIIKSIKSYVEGKEGLGFFGPLNTCGSFCFSLRDVDEDEFAGFKDYMSGQGYEVEIVD